jgi:hypothetical protein
MPEHDPEKVGTGFSETIMPDQMDRTGLRFKEKSSSRLYHAEPKKVTMAEINKLSVGKALDKLQQRCAQKNETHAARREC